MTTQLNKIQKATLIEIALLKALANRKNYDEYRSYVMYDKLLKETQTILDAYHKYYELYPDHTVIKFDNFLTQFCTNWYRSELNYEELEFFKTAIVKIADMPESEAETAIIGIIDQQLLYNIQELESKKILSSDKIRDLLDVYDLKYAGILKENESDCFTIDNLDFSLVDKSLGIPYALSPLQEAIGGQIPGSLVIVNAASGLGKTAFIVTQAVHTFKYLNSIKSDRPILWFNTEGTLSETYGRFLSNLYKNKVEEGYTKILTMQNEIQKDFNKSYNKELLKLYVGNMVGIEYIRAKLKRHKPAYVILDMAAHMVRAAKGGTSVADLEVFFNALRRLSSETCPIICTVQAGSGAKWWDKEKQKYLYKMWPTDDDIYGSRTAVQGSAETIITIGRDNDHLYDRYIQTTKKKAINTTKFKCELNEKYSEYRVTSVFDVYEYTNEDNDTQSVGDTNG